MRYLIGWTNHTRPVVAAVIRNICKGEGIGQLRAVFALFGTDKIVHNFSNMNTAFMNVELKQGDGPATQLPVGPELTMPPDYSRRPQNVL